MTTVKKANTDTVEKYTFTHKHQYGFRNVHPLYGTVKVNGMQCFVERLPANDDYKYEILSPPGYIFTDGTHTLLCTTLADVKMRAGNCLEVCDCADCKTIWKNRMKEVHPK